MKGKTLLYAMIIFLVPLVYGQEMCQDTVQINTNCTMLTPTLGCGSPFPYTIYNLNGTPVEFGNLTELNGSIFYFNFTLGQGNYIVSLCDNTTREVRVATEDTNRTVIGAIIFGMFIMAILFLVAAATMSDDHVALKIFLFLLSLVTMLASFHFGALSVAKFYNFPELIELLGTTTWWVGMVIFGIISYFILYAFYLMAKNMAQKKKERMQY